jgi:glycosyltransferase involved in cell wall biosynthesis
MKSHSPLISIGVPTFNRPTSLARTLEHLRRQTYKNIEIIISDNASPDPRVRDVATYHAKSDGRVRYYRQQENKGALANFKYVLQEAHGTYFMWAADDDVLEPDCVERLVEILGSNPGVELVAPEMDYLRIEESAETGYRPYLRADGINNLWDSNYALVRVASYFLYPERSGKPGFIYGMFRRSDVFGELFDRYSPLGHYYVDCLYLLEFLRNHRVMVVPGVLIHRGAIGTKRSDRGYVGSASGLALYGWTVMLEARNIALAVFFTRLGIYKVAVFLLTPIKVMFVLFWIIERVYLKARRLIAIKLSRRA